MRQIEGGAASAKGFRAASAEAGIKYAGRPDMAMLYSEAPCVAAGTFTKNIVKAAPVCWDQERIAAGMPIHAVVINAGIANACTGAEGMEACEKTAGWAAGKLSVSPDNVLVASTGVIGMPMPLGRLEEGVGLLAGALSAGAAAGEAAARAIMTTDTVKKECAVEIELGGQAVTVGGMCKGSGMIHPDMATMLAFTTTDVAISAPLLQKALSEIVPDTFNMVSVDRDTSTNDTYVVLANGMAGNPEITEEGEDYQAFREALFYVSRSLAEQIAADGEGATKLLTVAVEGAANKEEAKKLAKSIISSNLVKTAVFGSDANWGRILCAMGYAGVEFDPQRVDLFVGDGSKEICLVKDGVASEYREEEASEILAGEKVFARADVKMGEASATAWGCDLTYEYVKINGDYRS